MTSAGGGTGHGGQDRLAEVALSPADVTIVRHVDGHVVGYLCKVQLPDGGEVKRLRGLLKRLEWAGEEGARQYCPACTAYESSGHVRDCWLAAEIAATPHP